MQARGCGKRSLRCALPNPKIWRKHSSGNRMKKELQLRTRLSFQPRECGNKIMEQNATLKITGNYANIDAIGEPQGN